MRKGLTLFTFILVSYILAFYASYHSRAQTESTPPPTNRNTNQAIDKSGTQENKENNDTLLPKAGGNLPNSSSVNLPLPEAAKDKRGYLSRYEFTVAITVALVSVIALSMQFFLLLKQIPKIRAEDTLRTFGVTLIIMGSLLLIAVGFDSIQIAPAMGLFGTIAGYLLGRVERKENEKND
ncbi:MAG TPA: hypothetical protein VJ464_19545 [Blastocatellia bacterium]|nr:hypothetical protein [Blastocatellia bacterium]